MTPSGSSLGDYAPATGSPVINFVPSSATTYSVAPSTDFFGHSRKTNNFVDAGAVEFVGAVVAAPTLTSIAPTAGARSAAVPVTLTGTNLTGTSAVTVSGTGITVSAITVVNPTTVTATFTISGTATLSARTVSVTTPGGTRGTVTFTVQAPPTLTSIAPNTGARSTVVPVTLTGTNLTGTTAVTVSGSDITVGAITVVNSTTVTTTFTIAAGAALSPRTVNVTTPVGTSGNVTFTVLIPSITATLTPTTHNYGTRTRNCPGTGVLGILACSLDPSFAFTLTNTGNVTLTGITQGSLGGANTADYAIVPALSTCGTSITSLAPGATCVVRAQFKPLTSEAAGVKSATVSVTDAAGTQTSTLTGTAN
jgi:hypothetical protein